MMEITNRDRHRWQLTAVRALADLIEQAFAADLPAVDWRVATGARLLGTPGPGPDADKVAAVQAWANYLGEDVIVSTQGDQVRHQVTTEIAEPDQMTVTVTLMTSVYTD
jgi:hypothetical protein